MIQDIEAKMKTHQNEIGKYWGNSGLMYAMAGETDTGNSPNFVNISWLTSFLGETLDLSASEIIAFSTGSGDFGGKPDRSVTEWDSSLASFDDSEESLSRITFGAIFRRN